MATEKIGEGFNKDERENSGRINVTFILLMTFYHGRSVKSKFSAWKIEGLDFQWLWPLLPLLLLLACVQLNGSYEYTCLSAPFQMSQPAVSTRDTFVTLCGSCETGLCLALKGWDQMIKSDLWPCRTCRPRQGRGQKPCLREVPPGV